MLPAAVKIDKPREVYCEAGKIELFLSAQLNWKPGTSNGWLGSPVKFRRGWSFDVKKQEKLLFQPEMRCSRKQNHAVGIKLITNILPRKNVGKKHQNMSHITKNRNTSPLATHSGYSLSVVCMQCGTPKGILKKLPWIGGKNHPHMVALRH